MDTSGNQYLSLQRLASPIPIDYEAPITFEAVATGRHWPQAPTPASYHPLLRLPPTFWYLMRKYLTYKEFLRLSLVSRQFREVRLENYLPGNMRKGILLRIDRGMKMDGSPFTDKYGNNERTKPYVSRDKAEHSGCYLCFRMKPRAEFPQRQLTEDYKDECARVVSREPWTGFRIFERVPSAPSCGQYTRSLSGQGDKPARLTWQEMLREAPGERVGKIELLPSYCIECGLRSHLFQPDDRFMGAKNSKSKQYQYWVCWCRKAHPTIDVKRCPGCGKFPRLRD